MQDLIKQLINRIVRNQGLKWGVPLSKARAGEAHFLCLQMCAARGVPLNPARFSTEDESGDFAKVRRCYLTKIFFYVIVICGVVFLGQMMALKWWKSWSQAPPQHCSSLKNKS